VIIKGLVEERTADEVIAHLGPKDTLTVTRWCRAKAGMRSWPMRRRCATCCQERSH
jgi:hypothetical protein